MADDIKIAVYQNGELSVPVKGDGGNEAVLALPLDRLLVKVVKIPAEVENPDAFLTEIFKAFSPYPDEPIHVSYEVVRETETGRIVLAAALPEGSADDIGDALDAAKLNVTRVDSLALGVLRNAWSQVSVFDDSRRLLLMADASVISLFVLDGDCPVVVRALPLECDLKRETMLSLIEAESFAGPAPLAEVLVSGDLDFSAVSDFAPVREIDISTCDPYAGVIERTRDAASFNALPDSWNEFLAETRFKSKFRRFIAGALLIWGAMLGVIIGVPKYYDYKISAQKDISRRHSAQYKKVRARKAQVESVKSASNYNLGALETLRVVAEEVPEGFVFKSWNFNKGDSLKFSGLISDIEYVSGNNMALEFKDILSDVMLSSVSGNDEDSGTPFFKKVWPPKVSKASKGGVSFSYECSFKEEEEVE